MKKWLFAGLLTLVASISILFWQKENIFSSGIKIPLISREPTIVLAENLEKVGLSFSGTPIVSLNSLEASISGVLVFLDTNKDISFQVRALQLVLSRRTIDKIPKEVDLRFNNVVVRY